MNWAARRGGPGKAKGISVRHAERSGAPHKGTRPGEHVARRNVYKCGVHEGHHSSVGLDHRRREAHADLRPLVEHEAHVVQLLVTQKGEVRDPRRASFLQRLGVHAEAPPVEPQLEVVSRR